MSNRLRFHVDSQKAYAADRPQKEGFEHFAAGGDPTQKYANAYANVRRPDLGDDMVQGANIEELVSMQELIEMATKKES